MLGTLGVPDLEALVAETIPACIASRELPRLPEAGSEHAVLAELREIMARNRVSRSFIGMGYSPSLTPAVIQRNILENPGWYTQYTPYQAEISQGRLEALLNFQTMVVELTGLEISNSSLLDEGSAAAEAMAVCAAARRRKTGDVFWVSEGCHPQTLDVVRTRAEPIGIEVRVASPEHFEFDGSAFGALVQYPTTYGRVHDYSPLADRVHEGGGLLIVAADLLCLAYLKPPGELGADIAIGSTQRFGVPMGFGGPHAAYFATREALKRKVPGRLVGVTRDCDERRALRLALQSREQHIRRESATSNICTSQVLLAIMASMYAVYHGAAGLKRIAGDIHRRTQVLASALGRDGLVLDEGPFFDTLRVEVDRAKDVHRRAYDAGILFRQIDEQHIGITLDEATTDEDLATIRKTVAGDPASSPDAFVARDVGRSLDESRFVRTTPPLRHEIFERFHGEHELLRYIHRLQAKDLSLTTSMIPLGSCTMKLNAAVEMMPLSWPEVGELHPFAPPEQTIGYRRLIADLEEMIAEITGLAAVSLQPNAGSQGELAGLLAIREYHVERGEEGRKVCLIPGSAHGTNPASAVMAGMRVVVVACDDSGNIDLDDLRPKAERFGSELAAIMVTYPSTHGVFEESIVELGRIVHGWGGQVYLDGANLNAQVGLCRPGDYGVDVCHLNLHKTFAIPHGGGGPGVGPIAVAEHLRRHLPGHGVVPCGGDAGPIASSPFGSASVLPISWMYIRLMGAEGLRRASQVAILNANYMAERIGAHFPILYRGESGRVAHEFIVDLRPFKKSCGISVADIAKRLIDFGFHAPTISWPVPNTMMIEPTESESKGELDRLVDSLIEIRREIGAIEEGRVDRHDNPLVQAPHTAEMVSADEWDHPYSRSSAAYPAPWTREHKFWPPVRRVDDAWGDRNLFCICPSPEEVEADGA